MLSPSRRPSVKRARSVVVRAAGYGGDDVIALVYEPNVRGIHLGMLPRYRVRGKISASMTGVLRNASALEFFESRPTRRKTHSRASDGEGAVNVSR